MALDLKKNLEPDSPLSFFVLRSMQKAAAIADAEIANKKMAGYFIIKFNLLSFTV